VGILKESKKAIVKRHREEETEGSRGLGLRVSRRGFLFLPFAFLLLPSREASAQEFAWPDSWPQFRGNLSLTGFTRADVPATLRVLWTYEAGESVESSAAIVGGTVYVGSQKGELVALDLASGRERWKYATGSQIGESSPAVSGGAVYVGDLGGTVHAVSARTGQRLWAFKTGTEVKSSPVVTAGKVLIGSYDQHLYCLSARGGRELWKFKTNGAVHCTAAVAAGTAYIAGCDEYLRAVSVATGRELFNLHSAAYTGASPALMQGNAFYGTFNNDVLGANLAKRSFGWRYVNPERQFPYYSSAGVVDGRVVVGGRDKMVHCLDARNGRREWAFATQARVDSSPALASGRVFVGSNDGRLYVLDFFTGERVQEFNLGGPVSASPAVASGRVVVGTQDGRVYCLG
jgi:outer membrane protein assembly factor BamB